MSRYKDKHFTLIRKFDGIVDEIEQDLPQAYGVSQYSIRNTRCNAIGQFNAFFVCFHAHDFQWLVHEMPETEGCPFEFQSTGFNFGKIKNIVNDRQQRIRRRFDDVQVVPLIGRQIRVEHQFHKAYNGIQRGTDLMAHACQKFAFGSAGGFSGQFRPIQGFSPMTLGDIPCKSSKSHGFAFWVFYQWYGRLNEPLGTVLVGKGPVYRFYGLTGLKHFVERIGQFPGTDLVHGFALIHRRYLFAGAAENCTHGVIKKCIIAIHVHFAVPIGGGFNNCAKLFLAFPQCGFGRCPLVDGKLRMGTKDDEKA